MEPQALPTGPNFGDDETVTVSTTVVGLDPEKFRGHKFAYITVETDSVRVWVNNQNPTSSAGHEAYPGDEIILDSRSQLIGARFIRSGSSDATLQASYGD